MTKYLIVFTYGSSKLWAEIERLQIKEDDRRSFADIAQLAANIALEQLPETQKKYIARDFEIFEISSDFVEENRQTKMVYAFTTLEND